jgi:hypothetical protein
VAERAGVEPTVRFAAFAAIGGTKRASIDSQTVRFARHDIRFYDAHRIDLYRLVCALYLMA